MTSRPHSGGAVFDDQAATFDQRAGLPPHVTLAVAAAVREVATRVPGLILDIGAGTGEIGLDLVQATPAYLGLDASPAMLAVFRERAASLGLTPELVVADATGPWPVADDAAAVVFGSRSLHWIPATHLSAEAARVLSPGGAVLVGRIAREESSPREILRRHMRQLLRRAGHSDLRGGRRKREALDECARQGGSPMPARVLAEWVVRRAPRASIADWIGKDGLAGVTLSREDKAAVLGEVLAFAVHTFGDVDMPIDSVERYVLEGATLGTPEPR